MKYFGLCVFVAFTVSSVLMPLAVSLSKRWGAVSETGGRHVGQRPIGRLGGLGVVIGISVAVVVLSSLNSSIGSAVRLQARQLIGLILGAVLIGGIGFLDDIRRVPAKWKLIVQIMAALVVYATGLRLSAIDLPFLEPFHLGWFALPITILWIIGVVNAINLIDGLDGLAGGVVLFASLVNFVAAITTKSPLSAGIMAAVCGAALGFLVYNWYPAKVYLGDGGAYTFGFLLASSALLSSHQKASTSVALLVPVLASGLPIFDTILTMTRRALSRKGIFDPDRGHLHHVLLDAGISHRRVVIGLYALSSVMGSAAIAIVLKRNREVGYLLIAASLFGIVCWSIAVRKSLALIAKRFKKQQNPRS